LLLREPVGIVAAVDHECERRDRSAQPGAAMARPTPTRLGGCRMQSTY